MKRSFEYEKGYVLDYLFFPGRTLPQEEIEKLLGIIHRINERGMKLKYGIFLEEKNQMILNNIIICLIRKGEGYHGFFYAFLVDETLPLIHEGLVMIVRNEGVDLLTNPYVLLNRLIYEELKRPFFATNITAVPKSIGLFCDLVNDVWPSPRANLIKCQYPEYRSVLDVLEEKYIKNIFTYPDKISIDKNRFVLKSEVKAMGFETNFHKLSRDHRFEMNAFAFMWLKHDEEEDIVQVGKYDENKYAETKDCLLKFKEVI